MAKIASLAVAAQGGKIFNFWGFTLQFFLFKDIGKRISDL